MNRLTDRDDAVYTASEKLRSAEHELVRGLSGKGELHRSAEDALSLVRGAVATLAREV